MTEETKTPTTHELLAVNRSLLDATTDLASITLSVIEAITLVEGGWSQGRALREDFRQVVSSLQKVEDEIQRLDPSYQRVEREDDHE